MVKTPVSFAGDLSIDRVLALESDIFRTITKPLVRDYLLVGGECKVSRWKDAEDGRYQGTGRLPSLAGLAKMAQIGPESEEKENGPRDGDENDGGVSFFDFALLVVGKSEEEIGYDVHDEENRAKDDERNVQTVENEHQSWATHCNFVSDCWEASRIWKK